MPSMYDSHGDVLAIKVHKANANAFLKQRSPYRPTSAALRRPPTQQVPNIPGMAPKRRPQSAGARFHRGPPPLEFPHGKSLTQKTIDGEYGPAMTGVTSYPYSRNQLLYLTDFRVLVANTITHPFMATTGFNTSSTPHDLLAGSAFDDDRMGGIARKWRSETKRQYSVTDARGRIVESKTRPSCGVRSEQLSG